jgi:hypothetical protein
VIQFTRQRRRFRAETKQRRRGSRSGPLQGMLDMHLLPLLGRLLDIMKHRIYSTWTHFADIDASCADRKNGTQTNKGTGGSQRPGVMIDLYCS